MTELIKLTYGMIIFATWERNYLLVYYLLSLGYLFRNSLNSSITDRIQLSYQFSDRICLLLRCKFP